MRISDWSSDVCSSDLSSPKRLRRWKAKTSCRPASQACQRRTVWRAKPVQAAQRRSDSPRNTANKARCCMAQSYQRRGARQPGNREQVWRSEEHTSELQSLMRISYAVFCLKKKIILIQSKEKDTTNEK